MLCARARSAAELLPARFRTSSARSITPPDCRRSHITNTNPCTQAAAAQQHHASCNAVTLPSNSKHHRIRLPVTAACAPADQQPSTFTAFAAAAGAEFQDSAAQQQGQHLQQHKHQHTTSTMNAAFFTTLPAAAAQAATATTDVPYSSSSGSSNFPDLFHKGVAISVWQNSSDEHSNWTAFMRRKKFFGQQHLCEAFMESNDFWKKYHAILDSVEGHGLLPNATLHHFTHPQWFEERGGFANPANIPTFVNYSKLIFREFGHRIPFWATFNEPSCFCLCGFIMGLWAPGKRGRLLLAGRVLGNMLRAHVAVYRALKAMPFGNSVQVGLVHQHIRFIPHCNWLAGLIVRPVCRWMTYWFATQQVLTFFRTGVFTWRVPLLGQMIKFEEPAAVGALDWWGINYYSRPAINSRFQLVGTGPAEPLTGMGMPLVPGDLHRHLMEAQQALRVPLLVSETGVSDRRHELRARCISSYYNEVLRAIADGCDVHGVYYWTLMDNIEWHHGFEQHFGLYEWRPLGPNGNGGGPGRPTDGSKLQLRPGSKTLVALHAAWPDKSSDMQHFAQQHFAGALGPEVLGGVEGQGVEFVVLPGVAEQEQLQLQQEVRAADGEQQRQQDVQEPLLAERSGRISDAV